MSQSITGWSTRTPSLDPLLQREHQGAHQPLELPHSTIEPFDCGSYAGGDSSTVCTPRRSATARR
eukprot:1729492-Alexandrium_andersonii.AAC.1